MDDSLHLFRHEDIEGAVIRVLDDEVLSVNEFLPEVHQLDGRDEYEFAYTCCYLKHRKRHILVDAGFDPDTTPGALESIDVSPEDIELVLLTHADRDHIAGLLMHDGSLTYPHAQHVIGKELWDNLISPETIDTLDEERRYFYRKLIRSLEDSIQLYDGEIEVVDGVRFILSPGHRVGHAVYEFASERTPLVHTGDSFFHFLFAEHPDWPNRTDSLPEAGAASRKRLVERLVESKAIVLSTHMPFPGIGTIRRQDTAYSWEPTTR